MRLSHPTGEQNIFVGLLLLLILFHVAIIFTGKKYVLNVMEEEPPVRKTNNNDLSKFGFSSLTSSDMTKASSVQ